MAVETPGLAASIFFGDSAGGAPDLPASIAPELDFSPGLNPLPANPTPPNRISGMWSGWLQEQIGYQQFFVWVLLATVPGFAVVRLVKIDAEFGKKG